MDFFLKISVFVVFLLASSLASPTPAKVGQNNTTNDQRDYNELLDVDMRVLVDELHDWAHHIALITRTKENMDSSDIAQFQSVSLFPSPFPRKQFEEGLAVQKAMNLLYFRIARDYKFLSEVHADVVKTDKNMRNLMNILHKVHKEGIHQPITVLFQRADYMLNLVKDAGPNEQKYELKQIEVNCSAIADTATDRLTTELHRRIVSKSGMDSSFNVIPENLPDHAQVEGLYKAWVAFGNPSAILISLADPSAGRFDSRKMEYDLEKLSGGKLKLVRISYLECFKRLTLDDDFTLRLDSRVVAVAYSRLTALGYNCNWKQLKAREIIERSTAIKAPSLFVALSGSKKIQQILALPGQVERFFPDPKDAPTVQAIRKTFAGLWGLEKDDDETKARIQDAIAHPDRYVLKPNKDGGGHNFWGEEIVEKLNKFTPEERGAHILMQKLDAMVTQNWMIRPFQEPEFGSVNGELGVNGVLIGNFVDGTVQHNIQKGHLLKTKWSHVNEGGITAGRGVMDSPYLF